MRNHYPFPIRLPQLPPFPGACKPCAGDKRPLGFSLLEVILAIAILGMAMAMIGQLVNLSTRQAEEVRELTNCQLLCESKIAEVAAGVTPAEAVAMVPFENDSRRMYSITVNSLDQEGLIEVRVTVQQSESIRLQPLTFTLVSWMIDPSLASAEASSGLSATSAAESSAAGAGTGVQSSSSER